MRKLVSFWILLGSSVALAAPVTLPASGLTVDVPTGWSITKIDGKVALDKISRTTPAEPALEVVVVPIEKSCAAFAKKNRDARWPKLGTRPSWAPSDLDDTAGLDYTRDGRAYVVLCKDAGGGKGFAFAVGYAGKLEDKGLADVAPVVESLVHPPSPPPRIVPAADGRWAAMNVSAMTQDYFDVWGRGQTIFVAGDLGVHRSEDGGTTWKSSLPGAFHAIAGTSAMDVYAVGLARGIQHSSDGGNSWQELGAPILAAVTKELGRAPQLLDVWTSGEQVYVVGEKGLVLHSADRGVTFARIKLGLDLTLETVWGNKSAVFVGGMGGLISTTRDDGKTWQTVRIGAKEPIWDIWGVGDHDIYAVGGGGLVHGTGDGAWTAVPLTTTGTGNVTRIWGSTAMDFYCVIDTSSLVHTRDGGKTWAPIDFHSAPSIYGVWGLSPDDLFIVGSDTARHAK